jgi:hypothetical protein
MDPKKIVKAVSALGVLLGAIAALCPLGSKTQLGLAAASVALSHLGSIAASYTGSN